MYKKFIPKNPKDFIKVLLGNVKYSLVKAALEESEYFCPVCSSAVSRFHRLSDFYHENLDKHGYIFSIFQSETLNYLNYSCPVCGASDRDRLYSRKKYLESKMNLVYSTLPHQGVYRNLSKLNILI